MSDSTAMIIIGFGGLIFVLLFAGGGAFLIYKGLKSRKQAEASQGWPSTLGTVSESRVTSSTSTDSDGDTSTTYSPLVTYTFQVSGQEYRGKNVTFGLSQGYGNPAKAEAVVAQYPAGGSVTVYYDPADPKQAVLERKAGGFGASLALGILFLVLGLCLGCGGTLALLGSLGGG